MKRSCSITSVSSVFLALAILFALLLGAGCVLDEEEGLVSEPTPDNYASAAMASEACTGGKYMQFNYTFTIDNHPDCIPGTIVNGARAVTRCCATGAITNPGGPNSFGDCNGSAPVRYGDVIVNQCGNTCGDGIVEGPIEECDDGGESADCTANCMFQYQ